MRRIVVELPNSKTQVWCYTGRRIIQDEDCYVWERHLAFPEPGSEYTQFVYWHPVATFWPRGEGE